MTNSFFFCLVWKSLSIPSCCSDLFANSTLTLCHVLLHTPPFTSLVILLPSLRTKTTSRQFLNTRLDLTPFLLYICFPLAVFILFIFLLAALSPKFLLHFLSPSSTHFPYCTTSTYDSVVIWPFFPAANLSLYFFSLIPHSLPNQEAILLFPI